MCLVSYGTLICLVLVCLVQWLLTVSSASSARITRHISRPVWTMKEHYKVNHRKLNSPSCLTFVSHAQKLVNLIENVPQRLTTT